MSQEEFNKIFAKRLRYYLDINQMTQLELSKRLGVGITSVYNWCNGIKTPRMDKVDAMCEIFNCNRTDFMEDKYNDNDASSNSSNITTLAAHFEVEEFTPDELTEIQNFVEFVKAKRK